MGLRGSGSTVEPWLREPVAMPIDPLGRKESALGYLKCFADAAFPYVMGGLGAAPRVGANPARRQQRCQADRGRP
jgi:hypothetical protein